jgi:hypothetical protein
LKWLTAGSFGGASIETPVIAETMRLSRPFSLVSELTRNL